MVIDATKVFACKHEFVALPGLFHCHLCDHTREELPFTQGIRKALIFFPVAPVQVAEERKAG